MAFYEVIGSDKQSPAFQSAETLTDAKHLRDNLFATGKYKQVFIRQYVRDRHGNCDQYRILHRLTLRTDVHGKQLSAVGQGPVTVSQEREFRDKKDL